MIEFTIDEQIACVRRELSMRRNVYPKWVAADRIPKFQAEHEINCMNAVLRSLIKLKPAGDMLPGLQDKP